MKFYKLVLFLLLLTNICNTTAQNLGNNSSKIDWKSIDSENVRVIFPEGSDKEAKRIADVINYIHKYSTASVGQKTKKIDIILQTQQVVSNGFVTLSPFRSEFFSTSPQDFSALGSTEWLDLLAVHEYRHVLQFTNANRGATKVFHWIAGENGWSSLINMSIPNWYFEGDAVLSETLLSKNGRGRNPNFFKEQRALLLNDNLQSYMKARNGSFKDIVPNQYPLGFVMTNYIRNMYGSEIGADILADAGRYTIPFYPFSSSTKKHIGLSTRKLYKIVHKELQQKWKEELDTLLLSKSHTLTKPSKVVTNYEFASYLEDGSVVCIKSSFDEIPKLIRIQNKKEKKLTSLGFLSQTFLSNNHGKLAWTEFQRDLRRGNTNYSNIVTYDLKTKVKNRLTKKAKLFSPHFSDNGARIIAVESGKNIQHNLVILDATSGKIIQKISNPTNDFLSYPKWTKNDTSILYLAKRNSEIAFFKYNLKTSTNTQLSKWTAHTISAFDIVENQIYFTASYSGIENAYVLNMDSQKIKQITSVKNGMKNPVISKNKETLMYSNFTEKGYRLDEIVLSENTAKLIDIIEPIHQKRYEISTSNTEYNILDSIPKRNYQEKKYRGFFKGLKLHSWGFTNGNSAAAQQGLTLQFQNLLSDFSADILAVQNTNEKTFNIFSNATYSKYFLEVNLNSSFQNRAYISSNSTGRRITSFSEKTFGAGFSIPLSRIQNNYSQSLLIKTDFVQHQSSNLILRGVESVHSLDFGALETSLTVSNFQRTALQNLGPKFGQIARLTYNKGIGNTSAEKINISSSFYFPGILKNHNTRIDLNWQKELISNDYQYANTFIYARGYVNNLFDDEVLKASLNYQFPVLYPDFGFAGIAYLKRVRANLFYDYSISKRNKEETFGDGINSLISILPKKLQRDSFGGELLFDTTFLNILPSTIGLRNSFLRNKDLFSREESKFEMFFLLNF